MITHKKQLQSIQDEFKQQYGIDTKTKDIPFHITLGSYAVEETEEIVSGIINVANKTRGFDVKFVGIELGEFFPTKKIIRVLFNQ